MQPRILQYTPPSAAPHRGLGSQPQRHKAQIDSTKSVNSTLYVMFFIMIGNIRL